MIGSGVLASFETGSKETLDRDDIRKLVLEFYEKYYSANLMSLVIMGSDSLDVL